MQLAYDTANRSQFLALCLELVTLRVAETADIGSPGGITGQVLHAFVILERTFNASKSCLYSLHKELISQIRSVIGCGAEENLSTRSRKIMPHILIKEAGFAETDQLGG